MELVLVTSSGSLVACPKIGTLERSVLYCIDSGYLPLLTPRAAPSILPVSLFLMASPLLKLKALPLFRPLKFRKEKSLELLLPQIFPLPPSPG